MLASGDAGQLESWWEYYQIEPWGDDFRRTSTATARILNVLKQEAHRFSMSKRTLTKADLFEDDFLVPKLRKKEPSKKDNMAAAIKNLERQAVL